MRDIVLMAHPRVAAVPVEETHDDLVDVRTATTLAYDPGKDTGDGAYAHLRGELARRLQTAHDLLAPQGLQLQLIEGYRPYTRQKQLFDAYRAGLHAADPHLTDADSFQLASRFVSPPDIAPHVSGAAVDLTLLDSNGTPLDMGTRVNANPEDSAGACYFAADNITGQARHNRQLLAGALEDVGLVNYPTEWWHWSYGDRYWALLTSRPAALYGPLGDDMRPQPAPTAPAAHNDPAWDYATFEWLTSNWHQVAEVREEDSGVVVVRWRGPLARSVAHRLQELVDAGVVNLIVVQPDRLDHVLKQVRETLPNDLRDTFDLFESKNLTRSNGQLIVRLHLSADSAGPLEEHLGFIAEEYQIQYQLQFD